MTKGSLYKFTPYLKGWAPVKEAKLSLGMKTLITAGQNEMVKRITREFRPLTKSPFNLPQSLTPSTDPSRDLTMISATQVNQNVHASLLAYQIVKDEGISETDPRFKLYTLIFPAYPTSECKHHDFVHGVWIRNSLTFIGSTNNYSVQGKEGLSRVDSLFSLMATVYGISVNQFIADSSLDTSQFRSSN